MDANKIPAQLIVIAPIAHALVCFVFLYGYSTGFGANIGAFFAVTDIFAVSLNDLVVVYASGFLVPLLAISNQLKPDYKSFVQTVYESGNQTSIRNIKLIHKSLSVVIFLILALSFVFMIVFSALAIKYDYRLPFLYIGIFLPLVLALSWFSFSASLKTTFATDQFIAVVLTLFSTALVLGMATGQTERRASRDSFADYRVMCGNLVVLRAADERFIAVDPKNRRLMVNEDCQTKFVVPFRRPFEDVTYLELARRHLSRK